AEGQGDLLAARRGRVVREGGRECAPARPGGPACDDGAPAAAARQLRARLPRRLGAARPVHPLRRRQRLRSGLHDGRQGRKGASGAAVRKTLVVYLMSGPETPALAEAAVAAGADLVELGFPFSDPLADGPVIRRAAERALARGMRTQACLECLAATRERLPETPLVPMTYSSLLEAYGWER